MGNGALVRQETAPLQLSIREELCLLSVNHHPLLTHQLPQGHIVRDYFSQEKWLFHVRHKSSAENWLEEKLLEGWGMEGWGGGWGWQATLFLPRMPLWELGQSSHPLELLPLAPAPTGGCLLADFQIRLASPTAPNAGTAVDTKCQLKSQKEKGTTQSWEWPLEADSMHNSNNKRSSTVPSIIYDFFFATPRCLRKNSNSRIGRVSAYKLSQQEIQGPN